MRFPRQLGDFIIRKSPTDGCGIFATKRYAPGAYLFRVEGIRIGASDRRHTHRAIQNDRAHFIEPRRFSLGHYLNHSCAPSAYVDGGDLFARTDIRPGDEITADYSLFTSHPTWDMECACGQKACRGLIVPYGKLPPAIRNRDHRWTSQYLIRKFPQPNA